MLGITALAGFGRRREEAALGPTDTGWIDAIDAIQYDIGAASWSNLSNVGNYGDSNYAHAAPSSNYTNYLFILFPSLTTYVPSGAVINGVEVILKKQASSVASAGDVLLFGSDGDDLDSDPFTVDMDTWSTSVTEYTYGAPDEPNGFTAAMLRSGDFEIVGQFYGAGSVQVRIYGARIRIYYTP